MNDSKFITKYFPTSITDKVALKAIINSETIKNNKHNKVEKKKFTFKNWLTQRKKKNIKPTIMSDEEKIKNGTLNRNTSNSSLNSVKSKQNIEDVRTAKDILLYSALEMANINIKFLCEKFKPTLSEFKAFVTNFTATVGKKDILSTDYLFRLNKFIDDFLVETYPSLADYNKKNFYYVIYSNYTVSDWGSLYWSFLHQASILVQYALYTNNIDDVKLFPTLVYNIDAVLPCPNCKHHYKIIKNSTHIQEIIKMISFGLCVHGVYLFHKAITENVIEERFQHLSKNFIQNVLLQEKMFYATDFACLYNVYPKASYNGIFFKYERQILEWSGIIHMHLSILLAICQNVTIASSSNRLKECEVYKTHIMRKKPLFSNITTIEEHIPLTLSKWQEINYDDDDDDTDMEYDMYKNDNSNVNNNDDTNNNNNYTNNDGYNKHKENELQLNHKRTNYDKFKDYDYKNPTINKKILNNLTDSEILSLFDRILKISSEKLISSSSTSSIEETTNLPQLIDKELLKLILIEAEIPRFKNSNQINQKNDNNNDFQNDNKYFFELENIEKIFLEKSLKFLLKTFPNYNS